MSINGRTEMQTKLTNDATVYGLVGEEIYSIPLTPQKSTGPAISMYLSSPTDGGLNYGSYRNTCSCWSKTYMGAQDIQDAAFNALNRQSEDSNTFFVCSKLQVIPPAKIGGDYNAPLEVLVRQR